MTNLLDDIARRVRAKRTREGWIASCPAHDDQNPSLSLRVTDTNKVLWKCHAGCTQHEVFQALLNLGCFPNVKRRNK